MREVLFKKYIKPLWENGDGQRTDNAFTAKKSGESYVQVEGTGVYDDFSKGWFHQWAAIYEEFEAGPGNYTVALIEDTDGYIHEVQPTNFKFNGQPAPQQ